MLVRKTGVFVVCYAIISMILFFVPTNLRMLTWMDEWGTGIGWVLRITFLVAGFWLVAQSDEWDP